MADLKYKNAPVSEVIFGVTFRKPVLSERNFYLKLIAKLSDEFPNYYLGQPLANEELKGHQRNLTVDSFASGPLLHRLRSNSSNLLCQIQWNKIYLNWIRDDTKEVGNYPGYSAIFKKFRSILDDTTKGSGAKTQDYLYYELSYLDRIRWGDLISSIRDVNNLVNFQLPLADVKGLEHESFVFNTDVNLHKLGFMTFALSSVTEISGKQLLKLEFSIKGNAEIQLDEWFTRAHEQHIALFEKFVNPKVLAQWR